MLISLPTPRIQSIQRLIRETLAQGEATILKLSQLLGSTVSTHPAVQAAPLHYCHLERAKITALLKTQSQLQHCSDNLRQHEAGFNLVAPKTPQQKQPSNTGTVSARFIRASSTNTVTLFRKRTVTVCSVVGTLQKRHRFIYRRTPYYRPS